LWAFLENRIKNYLRGKLERLKACACMGFAGGERDGKRQKETLGCVLLFCVCNSFFIPCPFETFLVLFTFFVTG